MMVLFQVLTLHALLEHKNVLVDGSLRDGKWYHTYLTDLKRKFPSLHIGIIHVTARLETILNRVRRRAPVEHRSVPENTVKDAMEKIPESIKTLSHFMHMYACFTNEFDNAEPACRRLWVKGKSARSLTMTLRSPPRSSQRQRDCIAFASEGGIGGNSVDRSENALNEIEEDRVMNNQRFSPKVAATVPNPDAVVEPSGSGPPSSSCNFSHGKHVMLGSHPPPIHEDMEHYNEVINQRKSMKLGQTQRPVSAQGGNIGVSSINLLTSSSSNCINYNNDSRSSACDQATPSTTVDSNGKGSRENEASTSEMGTSRGVSETWKESFQEIFGQYCGICPCPGDQEAMDGHEIGEAN